MTDTPTPPMTQKQRALLVGWLREPYDCTHGDDVANMADAADQLEADGVALAALTAERDALQTDLEAVDAHIKLLFKNNNGLTAEIARLTADLATAREDGMREVKEIEPTQAQIDDACLSYRHDYGLMTPANRALMRFEATEWLLAWGKTITKGAAT